MPWLDGECLVPHPSPGRRRSSLDPVWLGLGASLGIGLLIGLERERNPAARAGVRTFALVALCGTLATEAGSRLDAPWLVPTGLAAVAAMLIVEYARARPDEEPGTTTVAAALVTYLLGALAGGGSTQLAGAIAIGVTALLYFKPEIEGFSAGLARHEQVSVLQFLVVTFIVLPLAPDADLGPYGALNPRRIWLVVVLLSGIGLASYVALRIAGARHGPLLIGLLGGMVSSTATTMLYARRGRESAPMRALAARVLPLANLVPLARIGLLSAMFAPALLPRLAPALVASVAAGLLVHYSLAHGDGDGKEQPPPSMRNPAALGAALQFAGLFASVLVLSAWLADLAGRGGLLVAALLSGMVDIDPIALSGMRLFQNGTADAAMVASVIGAAFLANVAFKISVLAWHDRTLALRVFWPLGAALAAGGAALVLTP